MIYLRLYGRFGFRLALKCMITELSFSILYTRSLTLHLFLMMVLLTALSLKISVSLASCLLSWYFLKLVPKKNKSCAYVFHLSSIRFKDLIVILNNFLEHRSF